MSYQYIYTPLALVEYKDAIQWYYERSVRASENFVLATSAKIESICLTPLRFRNTYKQFREASLKKYPYCIVYFIDEPKKMIVITAVYHQKRNPAKKFRT